MKKVIALLLGLAAVGAIGWQVYRRWTALSAIQRPGRGGPVAVELAPVRRAEVRELRTFTGTLQARSSYLVAPKVPGRLERLLVDIGEQVLPGQPIAFLDDQEYALAVEQAEAEREVAQASVEEARTTLELAQREFERVEALRQGKIVSEAELDQARAQYHSADAKHKVALAQVDQKTAAWKATNVRFSYTRLQAAWDGNDARVVGERFVDPGAMLKANDPVLSILDIGVLTGVVYATERDYPLLRVGQAASMRTDALGEQAFDGRIVRIAPLVKEASRQARVEVEVPNASGLLKPGMFIRASVELASREDATVVPLAALVRRRDRQGVFLAEAQTRKVRFVPVTVGIVQSDQVEVLAPPITGSVVTMGQHLLEDGSSILPVQPETAPGSQSTAPPGPGRPAGGGAR